MSFHFSVNLLQTRETVKVTGDTRKYKDNIEETVPRWHVTELVLYYIKQYTVSCDIGNLDNLLIRRCLIFISKWYLYFQSEVNYFHIDFDSCHMSYDNLLFTVYVHTVQPRGKMQIRDTIKDKINSSRTVAVIQRGPWSWTNSIIFITIAESR